MNLPLIALIALVLFGLYKEIKKGIYLQKPAVIFLMD
jgi:hypothetical protein